MRQSDVRGHRADRGQRPPGGVAARLTVATPTSSRWWRDDRLLWVDSRAGLAVGAFTLLLSGPLSTLYGLPRTFLLVTGAANLLYGSWSGWLRGQAVRPPRLIAALVVANATWAVLCLVAVVIIGRLATFLGQATLLFEACFVGGLAVLEWRARGVLVRS